MLECFGRWNIIVVDCLKVSICDQNQYKLLYIILHNLEVYEKPMPRKKKFPHCEAGEDNGKVIFVVRIKNLLKYT